MMFYQLRAEESLYNALIIDIASSGVLFSCLARMFQGVTGWIGKAAKLWNEINTDKTFENTKWRDEKELELAKFREAARYEIGTGSSLCERSGPCRGMQFVHKELWCTDMYIIGPGVATRFIWKSNQLNLLANLFDIKAVWCGMPYLIIWEIQTTFPSLKGTSNWYAQTFICNLNIVQLFTFLCSSFFSY